jgi:hypothetical protein
MPTPVTRKKIAHILLTLLLGVFSTAGALWAIYNIKSAHIGDRVQYAVIALTYGHEFAGSLGAGFECGVM